MSRVGKLPVPITKGVEVSIQGNQVKVKGPKGELFQDIHPDITVRVDNGEVAVERPSDEKQYRAMHGLYRALIANMIKGVSEGYKLELELVGVGYRAKAVGQQLEFMLGYSHPIILELPKVITVAAKQDKGENPIVTLESFDKQLLGQVAAKIRSFRKPEPYKGKGIRFVKEQIRRKAGKAAAKK
jgi:large subunit ribosomal protein L6